MHQQLHHRSAVARFVIIPPDQLDKVVVQRDSGLGVENARVQTAVEIRRYYVIFGILQQACKEPS